MKFKNLRQAEEEMLAKVVAFGGPNVKTNPDSNVFALVEDMAMFILDIQDEMYTLRYKYNMEEKDLLPLIAVLSRGESIPARTIARALGGKL